MTSETVGKPEIAQEGRRPQGDGRPETIARAPATPHSRSRRRKAAIPPKGNRGFRGSRPFRSARDRERTRIDVPSHVQHHQVCPLSFIPGGRRVRMHYFPDFTPTAPGRYCVTAWIIQANADSVPSNDTATWCFVVADSSSDSGAGRPGGGGDLGWLRGSPDPLMQPAMAYHRTADTIAGAPSPTGAIATAGPGTTPRPLPMAMTVDGSPAPQGRTRSGAPSMPER